MIVCCGEALIDMIPSADGRSFTPYCGGAVFNTAIGLGRQGLNVGLLSGVSQDLFGVQLHDALLESHVSVEHLIRSSSPTTLAFVTLVDNKASYAFYDENTAGRLLDIQDMPAKLPDDVSTLFFGGISLAVEPCADAYAKFLKQHADRCVIAVDPNIRSAFIVDEARYRLRLAEILDKADLIKISDDDLNWIDIRDISYAEKVADILQDKSAFLFLTLGADGVQIFDKTGLITSVSSKSVQVVDTIGAGDAFNAGLLTALSGIGMLSKNTIDQINVPQLQQAVAFASAFASDSVTRQGADPAWNFSL